jgi:hypothetical protein
MVPGSGDWAELLSIVCPWSSAQTIDPLGHHPLGHYPPGTPHFGTPPLGTPPVGTPPPFPVYCRSHWHGFAQLLPTASYGRFTSWNRSDPEGRTREP